MEDELQRLAIPGRKLAKSAIRQADSFQKLSPIEQIRQKPTMWINDVTPTQHSVYCFDGEKIQLKTLNDYIEGVERLFIEIISNAVDNCCYSIHYGCNPDKITVEISNKTITVINGGCNIPVAKTAEGEWIPNILFGELFSSSHYSDVKQKYRQDMGSGGTNGVGSTLVNVFSDKFGIIVEDPMSNKRFERLWSRCVPLQKEVITEDRQIKKTRISVTYTLDFAYFGLEEYSQGIQELFAFHAISAGFTAKVPIMLTLGDEQPKTYDVRLIKDYAALFKESFASDVKSLTYCHVESGKDYEKVIKEYDEIPKIELLLIDLDVVSQLTFVNGIMTPEHGIHLDEACKVFFGNIIQNFKVTLANAKKYVSMILSVRVIDPKFKSQSKTCLRSPKPEFNVQKSLLKLVDDWDILMRFKAINESMKMLELKKTDGKKTKRLYDIKQLDDANDAGTSKSKDCVLIVVEGESAAIYPRILRDMMPGGRDKYGIFLLKGKPINTMNATEEDLINNKIYTSFKQATGLQEGTDYTTIDKFKKLRYGHILLMTDADCDGWHIMGLTLCLFHSRFRSLVKRGYISFWRTPMLRAIKGKERLLFFTKRQFNKWRDATSNHKAWNIKYYKGLGNSLKIDIKEDMESGTSSILFIVDEDTDESMKVGFDGNEADRRKIWLTTQPGDFLENNDAHQKISEFINSALKTYSLDNIARAIPSVMDGLKESMRKALMAGISEFKIDGAERSNPPECKMMELVAETTKNYAYHHGETILANVIANMTQYHLGTNNVPWFNGTSEYGTIDGKEKPAARYATLGPAWWWNKVYNNRDLQFIDYVYENDKKKEPKFFIPVVAWVLCNGADGIGTGYSTSLPGYNIEEVAVAHLCLLNNQPLPYLKPWWRNFAGTVNVISQNEAKKKAVEYHEEDVTLDSEAVNSAEVCVIEGRYSIVGSQLIITALPLRTLEEFKRILKELIDEKIVSEYKNRTIGENIRFEIDLVGGIPSFDIVKKFRLRRFIGLTNMVLLDENGLPKKFKNVNEIIRYFHKIRLEYYEKRRHAIMHDLETEKNRLSQKAQLIKAILDGEIVYHSKKKQDVFDQITQKLPMVSPKIFSELKVSHLTHEEVTSLIDEKENIINEIEEYKKLSNEKLWEKDILEFLKHYRKIYGSNMRFRDCPW